MIYEIIDAQGNIENTIVADAEFMQANYPDGNYRLVPDTSFQEPSQAWEWYIDIGTFFDRFGTAKMAVLTSSDVGVQAIIKDTQVRKWLDLRLPELAQSVMYVASKIPAVTVEIQNNVLRTPAADHENLALRKLYFS